jgi:hypothetical protein
MPGQRDQTRSSTAIAITTVEPRASSTVEANAHPGPGQHSSPPRFSDRQQMVRREIERLFRVTHAPGMAGQRVVRRNESDPAPTDSVSSDNRRSRHGSA